MPDELQGQINELSKVVAETNEAYRNFVAEQDRARQAEADQAKRQKQELADLKGKLKFD